MTPAEIAAVVERLAYRAWPAEEEKEAEGWILRHSPGLRSRRINSATSPIGASVDPERSENEIRLWFAQRGSDPIVRILSVSDAAIDKQFASAGWRREAPTRVLTTHLEPTPAPDGARIVSAIEPSWADAKQRLTGMTDAMTATWMRRASDIRGDTAYASIERDGGVVAIGQGVVDEGWLGLFDLNTDDAHRRQGLANGIVADLEDWSLGCGAQHAYLQVEAGNDAACRLYEKRGYTEAYSYWYRRFGR